MCTKLFEVSSIGTLKEPDLQKIFRKSSILCMLYRKSNFLHTGSEGTDNQTFDAWSRQIFYRNFQKKIQLNVWKCPIVASNPCIKIYKGPISKIPKILLCKIWKSLLWKELWASFKFIFSTYYHKLHIIIGWLLFWAKINFKLKTCL